MSRRSPATTARRKNKRSAGKDCREHARAHHNHRASKSAAMQPGRAHTDEHLCSHAWVKREGLHSSQGKTARPRRRARRGAGTRRPWAATLTSSRTHESPGRCVRGTQSRVARPGSSQRQDQPQQQAQQTSLAYAGPVPRCVGARGPHAARKRRAPRAGGANDTSNHPSRTRDLVPRCLGAGQK